MFKSVEPAKRVISKWLSLVFAIGSLAGPLVQAATLQQPVAFTIPAGTLGSSLNSIAVQANLQIFFEQSTVDGLKAPAVNGTMSADQALNLLLANTHLEYLQNADDTILVRPKASARPSVARNAKKVQPAVTAATESAPATIEVPETEGSWILRVRGLYMDPRNRSASISANGGVPSIPENGITTNGRWYPEADLEHFWDPHWSIVLALALPERQDLDVAAGPAFARTRAGTFKLGMNDLLLKYTFLTDTAFRPYVGAGLNYSVFSRDSAAPYGLNASSTGPVAQTGFDVKLGRGWFLNADVKWARVRPELSFAGSRVGDFKVDPLRFGLGFGYRFGGAPAHSVPAPAPAPVATLVDSDGDGVSDDKDQCPNTPAGTQVNAVGCPLDSDSDGVADFQDRCPATPSGVKVDASGCPLDSDQDGVPDHLDRCPGTPSGIKVDASGCEVEELVLKGVNFQTGSATLTAESATTLDSVVAILRQRPNSKVEVHGYTDSTGSDRLNQRLSERRAQAVVDYFVNSGIPAESMTARGFGKTDPVATNATAEGRAQNRRVTVEFKKPAAR